MLSESLLKKLAARENKNIRGMSKDTIEVLMNHSWPGNVRELKGTFEYALVTCHEEIIQPHHLPETIYRPKRSATGILQRGSFDMHEIEKRELLEALKKTGGNQSKAAKILGVSRVTVWNRMKRFGIDAKRIIKVQPENQEDDKKKIS